MLKEFIEQTIIHKKMINDKLPLDLVLYENCAYNSMMHNVDYDNHSSYEIEVNGEVCGTNMAI